MGFGDPVAARSRVRGLVPGQDGGTPGDRGSEGTDNLLTPYTATNVLRVEHAITRGRITFLEAKRVKADNELQSAVTELWRMRTLNDSIEKTLTELGETLESAE